MGKLIYSLFFPVLILMLFAVTFSCTNSQVLNSVTYPKTATRLAFIQSGIITENSLDIFLGIYDRSGQLLNIEGAVEVVLWESQESTINIQSVPIQQWMNLPINAHNFEDETGNWLSMKYVDFIPEPGQKGYLTITFTPVDGINITGEGEIILLKGSCCA